MYRSFKQEVEAFDSQKLLGDVIEETKNYNKMFKEGKVEKIQEQEQIYIGLLQLTGKIIDNFDIEMSEKII